VNKLHWEVNWLIVRDGIYYGFGWIFHEEQNIRDLRLEVRFENNENQTIAASFGKPRDDVAASFAKFSTAKFAGFSLLGSCKQQLSKFSKLFLLVTFENGSVSEFPVPQDCIKFYGADDMAVGKISMRQLVAYVKRGIFLLGNLQITSLLGYVKRYFRSRPASFLEKGEDLRTRLDAIELRNIVMLIDHDFGGGANLYREQMVAEKIREGATVLIFSYYVATLSYVLMVRSNQRNNRFAIPGCNFLLELAGLIEVREIIYNTGVSFAHPEELPPLLVELKSKYHSRLTLMVHDFFMVCPSHYLLDDAGKYCGIPDISRCQTCLGNNQQDYSSLFQPRNIIEWRALWGSVIALADEIRTFSNDSLKLLQKAYPSFDPVRAVVKPHSVKHLNHEIIRPSYTASLRIGVVGQIGYHKGAKVVQELAAEIKARRLDIQIVVIGTIEALCEQTVVSQTGSYQHEKLPALIKSAGVNIMLFPSICPETFSYVVQELMELGLPVACFDLGAPAERLSKYTRGLVMKETAAPATLNDLVLFHQRVYLSS